MGEIYALSCAILWAFAVILLKRSGERIRPFALNLFRVGLSRSEHSFSARNRCHEQETPKVWIPNNSCQWPAIGD